MKRAPRLLIVDDGARYADLCHALLRDYDYATRCELAGPCWECPHRAGCRLTHAHDWAETREALAAGRAVDLVLLDVAFDLPDERLLLRADGDPERSRRLQGIEILRRLRAQRPELPVLLMTSAEALRFEDEARALFADEFVVLAGEQSFDARALGSLIERVLARDRARATRDGFVWGSSPAMAVLRQSVLALARTSLPMLILGETGSGKSALAEHIIHPCSGRKGPFVHLDLSAIPQELMAAELFGSARGAFSGAVDRPGRFEQASGGTLFLDEIGNLPPAAQRTLLLALETGRVTRLGEQSPRAVDVKLVAATNADLAALVARGEFRADLYARLNPSARARMPALRERREDLRELCEVALRRTFARGADRELLASYARAAGLSGPLEVSLAVGSSGPPATGVCFVLGTSSFAALRRHAFPGNLRELSLLLASAALYAVGDALSALEQGRGTQQDAARLLVLSPSAFAELLERSWADPGTQAQGDAGLTFTLRRAGELREVARDLERQLLERLFRETGGDFRAMAARLLRGNAEQNARRVRIRFNQLGLRARRSGAVRKSI